jgi:DNA polymerase-1
MNDELVKEVKWQEDPAISHDEVKLGGKLGIFFPDWSQEITIPNSATIEEIFSTIDSNVA